MFTHGLTSHPPDINVGKHHFSVNENGDIVYGIGAIKGVGEGPIDALITARNEGGILETYLIYVLALI